MAHDGASLPGVGRMGHMVDNGRTGDGHPTVIRRVAQLAEERRPDDPVFGQFLLEYYRELPEFDVDDRREDDLYAAALSHLGLGRHRMPGTTLVRVVSPDWDRDGWHSDRTLVMIVTDDAPFLVDTVRLVLERHGISTHLLVRVCLRQWKTIPTLSPFSFVNLSPWGIPARLQAYLNLMHIVLGFQYAPSSLVNTLSSG